MPSEFTNKVIEEYINQSETTQEMLKSLDPLDLIDSMEPLATHVNLSGNKPASAILLSVMFFIIANGCTIQIIPNDETKH